MFRPLLTSSPRETVQTDKHRTRFGKSLREVTSSPALQHALRDTLFDSDSDGDAASYFYGVGSMRPDYRQPSRQTEKKTFVT